MSRYDPPPSYYEPPEPERPPTCPICGEETDTYKRDYYGDIIGCDNCVKDVDAWDYEQQQERR